MKMLIKFHAFWGNNNVEQNTRNNYILTKKVHYYS